MANTSYLIALGSIYLTSTGLVGGVRCKSEVEGVDALQFDYKERIFEDFHGNPVSQQTNVGVKGRRIAINNIQYIPEGVVDSIVTAVRAAQLNKTTMALVGTGADTPNFSLSVIPDIDPVQFREFTGFGRYKNVTLKFIAAGVYP